MGLGVYLGSGFKLYAGFTKLKKTVPFWGALQGKASVGL